MSSRLPQKVRNLRINRAYHNGTLTRGMIIQESPVVVPIESEHIKFAAKYGYLQPTPELIFQLIDANRLDVIKYLRLYLTSRKDWLFRCKTLNMFNYLLPFCDVSKRNSDGKTFIHMNLNLMQYDDILERIPITILLELTKFNHVYSYKLINYLPSRLKIGQYSLTTYILMRIRDINRSTIVGLRRVYWPDVATGIAKNNNHIHKISIWKRVLKNLTTDEHCDFLLECLQYNNTNLFTLIASITPLNILQSIVPQLNNYYLVICISLGARLDYDPWQKFPSITTYHVQISNNRQFSNNLASFNNLNDVTKLCLAQNLIRGDYYIDNPILCYEIYHRSKDITTLAKCSLDILDNVYSMCGDIKIAALYGRYYVLECFDFLPNEMRWEIVQYLL